MVARNQNGGTGEQLKIFSYLFNVYMCEYGHVYMSKNMWRSQDKLVEVVSSSIYGSTQVVRLDGIWQAP